MPDPKLHTGFDWSSIECTDEQINERIKRVHGDTICHLCGKPYKMHPLEKRALFHGEPWLVQLCNGILGKT